MFVARFQFGEKIGGSLHFVQICKLLLCIPPTRTVKHSSKLNVLSRMKIIRFCSILRLVDRALKFARDRADKMLRLNLLLRSGEIFYIWRLWKLAEAVISFAQIMTIVFRIYRKNLFCEALSKDRINIDELLLCKMT